MQEDASIKPSHPWRVAAFVLLMACCVFTGWVLGHAIAVCGPVLHQVAEAIHALIDPPAAQDFVRHVGGF